MSASEARALARWGDSLRRAKTLRSRRRAVAALAFAAGLAAGAMIAGAASDRLPLLVWNASASEPEGLYAVERPGPVRAGELVVAWAPAAARALAAERGYLPFHVPLVKRVAATAGDRICASGLLVTIEGRARATRLQEDSLGRPMPRWHGCRLLASDRLLLLGNGPRSFDGRYFGPSAASALLGRAVPLWLR